MSTFGEDLIQAMGEALAHAEGKDYATALDHFEAALALAPDLIRQGPTVGYNIATAYHRCRDLPAAREFLAQTLKRHPGYEPARRLLAHLGQ